MHMKMLIDNLIDIRINNDNMYILKKHTFSSITVEKQIKSLPYSGEQKNKNELVENSLLPPFIVAFYKFIFEFSKIPSEVDLTNYYFYLFYNDVQNNNFTVKQEFTDQYTNAILPRDGIFHRLLRGYPSLIRDFHFLILCNESNFFDTSYYSLNIDYYGGYDVIVKCNNSTYGVSLHIDTKRGNHYKNKKNNRHSYTEMVEVVVKATRDECIRCGRIDLFTLEHVKKLKKQIDAYPKA